MQRHILGICALFLLAGAVYFRIRPPESELAVTLYAACTRVGTLCAALWLAYRDLERLPRWIGSVILVAAVAIACRPRLAVIAIPLVIALTALGWRKNKRS